MVISMANSHGYRRPFRIIPKHDYFIFQSAHLLRLKPLEEAFRVVTTKCTRSDFEWRTPHFSMEPKNFTTSSHLSGDSDGIWWENDVQMYVCMYVYIYIMYTCIVNVYFKGCLTGLNFHRRSPDHFVDVPSQPNSGSCGLPGLTCVETSQSHVKNNPDTWKWISLYIYIYDYNIHIYIYMLYMYIYIYMLLYYVIFNIYLSFINLLLDSWRLVLLVGLGQDW